VPIDFLDPNQRKKIISEIKGQENKERKAVSLKQYEIMQDRQHQYVVEYLRQQFSSKTVKEMPVVSSINLARRIVTKEASLYLNKPSRTFQDADENQTAQLNAHYNSMSFDSKMMKSNQCFKLQNQNHLMIIPKEGKLNCRVLMSHHVDVVPSDINPEKAEAYIISSMDKNDFLNQEMSAGSNLANPSSTGFNAQSGSAYSDRLNQKIGDPDDWKATLERYAVWTNDLNFVMDGNGKIISDPGNISNPIGILPFVDISYDKDFEYFVRSGASLTDFSVQYCGALSDLGNVVKMQGWAQAWMKGDKNLMPENIQIGPNFILKLPIDPDSKVETDFGYSNPSPDLAGSIQYIEMILSSFLSSRGLDPSIVSSKGQGEKFSSGVERLLAMISQFEASKGDMELYRQAEVKAFDIIVAWNNILRGSDLLDKDLQIAEIPEGVKLSVKFAEPQMIQSRNEQLDAITKERELGLKSRIDALMELNGIDREQALVLAEEIDKDELLFPKSAMKIPEQVNNPDQGVVNGQDKGLKADPVGSQSDA